MNKIKEVLSFDDVLLVPQYSNIPTRKKIDLSSSLTKKISLEFPIVASPMDTVCEWKMALEMYRHGGLGIIHRYMPIQKQVDMISLLGDIAVYPTCAAIGVSKDDYQRLDALEKADLDIVLIDVAHGDHEKVITFIKEIKGQTKADIIVGNVATAHGYARLVDAGADCVRLGIGSGAGCETRIKTGHGIPTLQTIMDVHRFRLEHPDMWVPIMADGGIKNSGDAVKALAAGADTVMIGSLLAGTDEAPGIVNENGDRIYRGMASPSAQYDWRGYHVSDEGVETTVPHKGPMVNIIKDLSQGIKSGLSYSGCWNIKELHEIAEFVRQTPMGLKESLPHILS